AVLALAQAGVFLVHDLRLGAELDDRVLRVVKADSQVAADLLLPAVRLRAIVDRLHLVAAYDRVAAEQRGPQKKSDQYSCHRTSLRAILEYCVCTRTSPTLPTPESASSTRRSARTTSAAARA